jgi:hypothetical protein
VRNFDCYCRLTGEIDGEPTSWYAMYVTMAPTNQAASIIARAAFDRAYGDSDTVKMGAIIVYPRDAALTLHTPEGGNDGLEA